jgi:hypothetical protein
MTRRLGSGVRRRAGVQHWVKSSCIQGPVLVTGTIGSCDALAQRDVRARTNASCFGGEEGTWDPLINLIEDAFGRKD